MLMRVNENPIKYYGATAGAAGALHCSGYYDGWLTLPIHLWTLILRLLQELELAQVLNYRRPTTPPPSLRFFKMLRRKRSEYA